MSKTNVNVTLDSENKEWIDANYNNRSAFINDLITQYRQGTSGAEDMMARFRLEELQTREESLKTRLEMVREQQQCVESTVQTKQQRKESEFEEWDSLNLSAPITADAQFVQDAAEEIGTDAETLVAEYREWSQ